MHLWIFCLRLSFISQGCSCVNFAFQKINQKNTWELSLIDHLSDIIKVEDDDTETNFQKVSPVPLYSSLQHSN